MTQESMLHQTIAERVADQLRDEISRKVLAAGQPLRQNEIAARLGVSSTPVREAFQILEGMSLVEREGRRGVRVFQPSMRDLVDTYEVRKGLESHAAGLAAQRRPDDSLIAMKKVIDRMHKAGTSQQEFLRLNTDFHVMVARGSGNARLTNLVESELAATVSFVAALGVIQSSADKAQLEHAAILAALEDRDSEGAMAAMSAHLNTRLDELRSRLDVLSSKGDA